MDTVCFLEEEDGSLMFSDGKISPAVGSLLPLQATSVLPGLLMKRFQDKMTKNRPQPRTVTNTEQQPTTLQQFFRLFQTLDQKPRGMFVPSNTERGNKSDSPF